MSCYKYLFPFEKIPYCSKILIYGAGTLGQAYYTQLLITQYCEVIAFVDKNYEKYKNSIVPVYSPDEISSLAFDYVVIALRMEAAFNEVRRILLDSNIPEKKIVAVFERQYEEIDPFEQSEEGYRGLAPFEYSYKNNQTSIAILTTGGYGDMVIQKKIITEIIALLPDVSVDIYNIKAFEFLKTLYTDEASVKNIIPDLGSRYLKNNSKYSLALTIEACHFIRVDYFNDKFWDEKDYNFSKKIKKLIDKTKEEAANILMPAHVTMYRRWLQGLNAYTGFNYGGTFEITDKNVNIPLDLSMEPKFLELKRTWGCSRYITVNCGNGDCADGSMVAKSWPMDFYDELIADISEKYPNLYIVQLGANTSQKIKGCHEYLLGQDFSLVEYVLKNSYLHIDIEGGLVHIASQLGTKCVVLFGPTVLEYYGYENNINIRAGMCHNCWGLYSDVNKCARDMKEPECMYSITPDIVFEHVKRELDNV